MKLMTGLYPIENESIRSFLIRLSVANDFDMVSHMLSEYQEIKQINMNSCEDSLFSLANSLTVIKGEQVFAPVKVFSVGDTNRLGYQAITQRHPMVCPECMTMQRHTDAHWQLYPMTHCHKHAKRLMSDCVCGAEWCWDQDLLSYGCGHCHASWQKISSLQPKEELPEFIHYFHQLPIDKRNDYLEDLLTACMRALRPYDSVHHGIKQLHHCDIDWSELCKQAYALLTDRAVIEQWCQSMVSVRCQYAALGSRAVFHPLNTLQARLHGMWLINTVKPLLANTSSSNATLPNQDITPSKARNSAIEDLDIGERNQQLIHHIDQNGFSQMLGCDLDLVRKLFKLPPISTLSPVGRGRFSFIDIREFLQQTKLQNRALSCETVKLIELDTLLGNYMMTTDDALTEVYKHQLPIYVDRAANTLVEAIQINEDVLARHLESSYLESVTVISLTLATRILKLSRNRVRQLGELGLLELLPSKPYTYDYTGKSVAHFLKSYECLKRWADQHHVCYGKVLSTLKESGFKPAVAPFVFAKTSALVATLNRNFGDHWQLQEQLELFAEAG